MVPWDLSSGVVELPDGARIRGRGLLRDPIPDPWPEWGLYCVAKRPDVPWPHRWLRWPDFLLPLSFIDARAAFEEAHHLALAGQRVEVACGGGVGRTGTALACIAQLAGVQVEDATVWARQHCNARAVEMPWQRWYARNFARLA